MRSNITAELLFFTHSYMNILHETTSLCNQIIETLNGLSFWANFFYSKVFIDQNVTSVAYGCLLFLVQDHCSALCTTDLDCFLQRLLLLTNSLNH